MKIKDISKICGWLYIVTILASPVSNLFLNERLIDAENISATFKLIAENAAKYRLSVSIDFLAMVAVMVLAFSLYSILKPVNLYFAFLALGLRIGEVVLQAGAAVPDYLLLPLSQSAITSSATGSVGLEHLGQMLLAGSTQTVWLSFVFFSIGSLFNNYLFYKGRLIPQSLSIYGLIATGLYALGSIAALVVNLPEIANMVMMFPLVLFELSLGIYLATFGIKGQAAQLQATSPLEA